MRNRVLMVHALGGMRGPARTMASLAARVAESWDVDVAAPHGFVLDSVDGLHSVRIRDLPLRRSRPTSWLVGSRGIVVFVNQGPVPDLIHANGLSALSLVAPIALRRSIPILVHFHGSETGARARMLAKLWTRLGVRMRIHPVSEQSRGVLMEAGLGPTVGAILPNPIALAEPAPSRGAGGEVHVGFVGGPSKRKGLHVFVDIATRLGNDPVTWIVFGVDPASPSEYVRACRERLAAAGLAGRVVWGGIVQDVDQAYGQMDVLLVPSLQESWCRVAMEGMAAGLPVVAADIPGMAELFARVPGALTFPVDRPDLGAEHVRRLVADAGLRRSLGSAGREAMRAFDVDAVTSQLLELYERSLSRPQLGAQW